ncbi:hypothetical protein D3C72_1382200 [compost metagenome]
MLLLAADFDPLAAGTDEVFERGVEVELVAHLVEVRHLLVGAAADLAAVGLEFAQDQLEQRRLAGAVRAQQADLVAAQDGAAETADHGLLAEGLGGVGELGHDLAAGLTRGHVHVDAALHLAARGAAGAQFLQPRDAALAARAAGFDALADPDLFLRQQLVGLGADDRLLRELLFLLDEVLLEVARVGTQLAPVELHDAGGDAVQEAAVVGDGDDAALEVDQQLFQPLDGVEVQVVGGFV